MIVKIRHTKIKRMKTLLRCQARDMMKLEEFRVDVCVRDYHIYKDIWYAVVSEVIVCEEPNNSQEIFQDINFYTFNFHA